MSRRSDYPSLVPSVGENRPQERSINLSHGPQERQSANEEPFDEKRLRSRVERDMIRGRVPRQKAEKYRLFCFLTNTKMQTALEEAMDDLLAKHAFQTGAPVLQCATDHDLNDQIDDEKERSISPSSSLLRDVGAPGLQRERRNAAELLAFYQQRTGNPIKETDRAALREVATLPDHSIRTGIIYSVLRCPTRVNSLRYCIPAIKEVAQSGMSEDASAYLEKNFDRQLSKIRASRQS